MTGVSVTPTGVSTGDMMKRWGLILAVLVACVCVVFCLPTKRGDTVEKVRADVGVWFHDYTTYSDAVIRGEKTPDLDYEAELTARMKVLNQRYTVLRGK
jgi:hypothetical protein